MLEARAMPLRDLMLAVAIPLVWGVAFTLAKPASEHFPPLMMTGGVFVIIAVVFSLLFPGPFRTRLWPGLLTASCAGSLQAIPLFIGLAGIDASVAVLVVQSQVPLSVIAAAAINGERISPLRMLGIVIALAGVAAVAGLPAEAPALLPLSLVVLGAGIWAVGQALLRRFGRDEAPKLFRLVALHSAPQLILGSLLLETGQFEAIRTAGAVEWGSFALLAIGGFMTGNLIWYTLLQRRRIDQVAPFLLLMPLFGVVASAMVLGERLDAALAIGGGLIVAGLALVVLSPSRRAAPQDEPAAN
jgi:O-acetylserine/cysteine efflux transporter